MDLPLGAGRLATPMLVGSTLMCLESFPEQAARVRADRSLVPTMLEETMRFVSPGNQTARATNREVEIGGKTIPKDQLVMLWMGPANRDPRGFTDPNSYDVTRNPNPHVGFGRGSYYCMGAQMLEAYPMVPLFTTMNLGIAVMSYCGALYLGLLGDREHWRDMDVLVRGVEDSFSELSALALSEVA